MTTAIDQMRGLMGELGQGQDGIDFQLTLFPSGSAMLDLRKSGRAFVMAYSPTAGFSVDELGPDEGLSNHYAFNASDFSSAADHLRSLTVSQTSRPGPSLALLVIQAKDLDASLQFYQLLGLRFVQEQHGTGPRHHASELGPLVFEIYPCRSDGPISPVRLGFRIPAFDGTLELLRGRGVRIISEPKQTTWGRRAIVEDPDGNRVELTAPA